MNRFKLLRNILSLYLVVVLILSFSLFSFSATFYETQYEHSTSDIAWLSDLSIKLNLDSVSGVINSLTLKPVTDYPYSETAESFKNDIEYFSNINLLNEGAPRAAYLYFFEILASTKGLVAGEMSDSDIKSFFKAQGIDFDLSGDKDSLIVARAVYAAIVTGTLSDYTSGSSLDDLSVDFICKLSGLDKTALKKWLPESENPSLDEYLLAASKSTLWTAGYDVDVNTDETTVYKLMACMVIENNGLTADSSSDFTTLKLKFLSAMLSKEYNISSDWEEVGIALENDSLPLYVLKTIGMRDGISVGDRDYEDAFSFVAENTDEFDLEDQFYADIYNYTAEITTDTEKLWVNATPVCSNGTVVISANGTILKNSYYSSVIFDTTADVPVLSVSVTSVQGSVSSDCSYKITFTKSSENIVDEKEDQVAGAVNNLFLSSETLLSGLLATINLDTSSSSLNRALEGFDNKTKSVMSEIAPTFDDNSNTDSQVNTQEECIEFLDKIGTIIDSDISGIDGISVLTDLSSESSVSDFISFGN